MPSAPKTAEPVARHRIPATFRVSRVPSKEGDDEDVRPASRFFIAGSDSVLKLQQLGKAIEMVFAGSVFGGFSRISGTGPEASGLWELIVNVNRHKAELPCVKEIEKVLDFAGLSGAVEAMDERLCNHVVACVARLSQFKVKVGSFPKGFKREVQHYQARVKDETEREGVEQYTGRNFNATSFINLYEQTRDAEKQLADLNRRLADQRKLIDDKGAEIALLHKRVMDYQSMLTLERKKTRSGVQDFNLRNSRMVNNGEHLGVKLPPPGQLLFDADSIPDVFPPARESIPEFVKSGTMQQKAADPKFPIDPFQSVWVGGVPLPVQADESESGAFVRTVQPLPDFVLDKSALDTPFPPPGVITQRVAIGAGTHLRDFQFSAEWKGKRAEEYPYFIDFTCRQAQPLYSMSVRTRNSQWQDLPPDTPIRTRARRQDDGSVRIDMFAPLSAHPFVSAQAM